MMIHYTERRPMSPLTAYMLKLLTAFLLFFLLGLVILYT